MDIDGPNHDDAATQVYHNLIKEQREWLSSKGRTTAQSGHDEIDRIALSLHSDLGPADHEKAENQDFILAWCSTSQALSTPRLVIALADGVSDSDRSDWAAALACWISVRTVVEHFREDAPLATSRAAFNAAGEAIGALADVITNAPDDYLPEDQFAMTWEYILRMGKFLQTTLMLAWLDSTSLHVVSVGDGGAVIRQIHNESGEYTDRTLAKCDLDSNLVNAIGPFSRRDHDFDCVADHVLEGTSVLAFFTDGVGRAISNAPESLMSDLQQLHLDHSRDIARSYLRKAFDESPNDYCDNVSLLSICIE